MDFSQHFKGRLIVSCQALEDEPLRGSGIMARMALAAQMGGAVGIRANSPDDIREIKATVKLPIIGLWKIKEKDSEVYITPNLLAAQAVAEAGADIIALDATFRRNAAGRWAWELIQSVKSRLGVPVMADVSTVEEGLNAEGQGADFVTTALSGYTSYSCQSRGPDLMLVEQLSRQVIIPVLAEGRYWTVEEAGRALELGAHSVVIGSAITRPQEITKRFADGLRDGRVS